MKQHYAADSESGQMRIRLLVALTFFLASMYVSCVMSEPPSPPPPPPLPPVPACSLAGTLPNTMLLCRNWISFAPSRPFNPNQGIFPSTTDLRADLRLLVSEGWRGLVTYSLDGTLGDVPRIAKEEGFRWVIAGLFWFDDAQLTRERAAALTQLQWIDGFVLGNEGLQFGRYTRTRLESEILQLKMDTGRPVTTTEPSGKYLADPTLLNVGDWVFPNIHPWFANIRSIPQAVQFTNNQYQMLFTLARNRVLVVKESWWPTGGADPSATETNQRDYFQQLAPTGVKFIWGEAFDQFWKTGEGSQGPHWGFHNDQRGAKPIIQALQAVYTTAY